MQNLDLSLQKKIRECQALQDDAVVFKTKFERLFEISKTLRTENANLKSVSFYFLFLSRDFR